MDNFYSTDNNDIWQEFCSFPSELFSEEPKFEGFDVEAHKRTSSAWDASSWYPSAFCGNFSSTGSTDSQEDVRPILLPAADFVFQTDGKTETLEERIAPRPITETVTTGHAAVSSSQPAASPLSYEAVMKLLRSEDSSKSDVASRMDEEINKKGKRKMPDVDLNSISDPEERRRQKRMAKNRRTAAVSRLRKKARLDNLEHQIESLQKENQKLKSVLSYFLSHGGQLGSSIDELATLMTVLFVLAIVQSMAVPAVLVPMTLVKIINLCPVERLISQGRFAELHFTRHSAARWQRTGVT